MFSKITLLSCLAAGALAQTTLNLFVDGASDEKYVGSVVSANCDTTIVALRCTAGTYLSTSCDPSATALATYGPNSFEVSSEVSQAGTAVTIVETCSLDGTTKAVCSASIGVSVNGQHTAASKTTTLSQVNDFQVPITAGASKLPSKASCTSSGAAAPTGITDVYKVLVVPAAILAGALA